MIPLKEFPLDRFYSQVPPPCSNHGCLFFPYLLHTTVFGPSIISLLSCSKTQKVSLIFKPENSLTPPTPDSRSFLPHPSELKKLFCKRCLSPQRIPHHLLRKYLSFINAYVCIWLGIVLA